MTRVFIINGHPGRVSLSHGIAEAYANAAREADHEVRLQHLNDMRFDMDHENGGYRKLKPLEPVLENFLENLNWAEHIVLTTPVWWGGMPAKLKGLFDRTLLPGRAFNPRNSVCGSPEPMLSGRTARVFATSDTPSWAMAAIYFNALFTQIRKQIFAFIGVKPTRIAHFNKASHPSAADLESWLAKVEALGAKAN